MPTKPTLLASSEAALTPELVAAQQRLMQLRKEISRQSNNLEPSAVRAGGETAVSYKNVFSTLPAHLGWGSQSLRPVTATEQESHQPATLSTIYVEVKPDPTVRPKTATDTISIYPELALAFLREQLVAVGRVWVMLRFLDEQGCGWIGVDEAKIALTKKSSLHRVCGWRQMRNLLNQGEGLFWRRENGRIWLTSLPKLLIKLNLTRLSQNSVAIPLPVWKGKIGTLRAHLYASFHSSRASMAQSTKQQTAPIARATLETITSVSPRIQRLYEQTADVAHHYNYCIGAPYSEQTLREAAWQHGRATFKLTDSRGKQGRAGQAYVAWQLPNSYAGPHQKHETDQRKRINKRLTVLLHQGKAGNGQLEESNFVDHRAGQRYFANGRLAAKAITHNKSQNALWPQPQKQQTHQIWHQMEVI